MIENTATFKKISPQEALSDLQKKVENSKNTTLRPAGPKGMDKLKLTVLDGMQSFLSKTRKATKWSTHEDNAIPLAIGGGVIGMALLSGISPEMISSLPKHPVVWALEATAAWGAVSAASLTTNALASTALKRVIDAKRNLNNKLASKGASPFMTAQNGGRL